MSTQVGLAGLRIEQHRFTQLYVSLPDPHVINTKEQLHIGFLRLLTDHGT